MTAAQQLQWRYADPLAAALHAAGEGSPVVGITSNTVPREPFFAAGCFPVVLNPASPTKQPGELPSDRFMEDVFEQRIRSIFDTVVGNTTPKLRSLVIPRTSEQEHKLFLYLREVARVEPVQLPDVFLYNLLHTRTSESEQYGMLATTALLQYAQSTAARTVEATRLHDAIQQMNRCRQSLRQLHAWRRTGANTISGVEAMQYTGAFYFSHPEEYSALLGEVVQAQAGRETRKGKRLLLKGASLPHMHLHAAIEEHGVTIVAEDDWWGSRAATPDVDESLDPTVAFFRHSFFSTPSPRIFPPSNGDEWFLQVAQEVDAVIFFLPSEDDVFGWDFPRWKQVLQARGTPHYLVRKDARDPLDACWHDDFQEFLNTL